MYEELKIAYLHLKQAWLIHSEIYYKIIFKTSVSYLVNDLISFLNRKLWIFM